MKGPRLVRGSYPAQANPDVCKAGRAIRRRGVPINASNRHVIMYDPAKKDFATVSTCFPTHHVQFGFDANRTLWASSGGAGAEVLGWSIPRCLKRPATS